MQLLLFLGMAMGILMVVFLIGSVILSKLAGISMLELGDVSKWDASNPRLFLALRGMLILQFLGLFLLPSLLFAYFSDPQPARYLGLKAPSKPLYWLAGIVIMLVAIPFVEYTGVLNKQMNLGKDLQVWAQSMEEEAAKTIQFMLQNRSLSNLAINLVFIAAFAGIGEELFFRGILQRLFIRGTRSPWIGILLAAAIFSFFHFQFFGFIPRFILGILLGAIYWYSGSLWPAILAHFFYDGFFLVIAYLHPEMVENPDASLVSSTNMGVAALVSAVLVGVLLWWMKRSSTASYTKVYSPHTDAPSSDQTFTF